MNKILSSIIGGSLGLALVASVGVGIVLNNHTSFNRAKADDKTSTLVFTDECEGVGVADDGVVWTVTSDAEESLYEVERGIHYGTNSSTISYLNLSTSGFSNEITKIVVNCSRGSGGYTSVAAKVNGNNFGSSYIITETATDYTFTGSATGDVLIAITQKAKASPIYCKSIVVTYTSTATLESVTVSGTMTKKGYFVGDNWDHSGLTAIAHFSDRSTENVTNTATWTYNPASADNTAITSVVATATYNGKSGSSNIQRVNVREVMSHKYNLVTSESSLQKGAKYVVASASSGSANFMGGQKTNNRDYASATISNNSVTITTEPIAVITLGGSSGAWTLNTDEGYLYAPGDAKNYYLRSRTSNSDAQSEWTISIANDGKATIVAKGSNQNRYFRYNSSSLLFSCYNNAYNQKDVYLFMAEAPHVTGLTMTGSMNKTEYLPINSWDPTGFTVTASYSDNISRDVTVETTWTYSPDFPTEGVTSVIATANYDGYSVSSAAQAVSVVISTTSPYANGPEYHMFFRNGSTHYFIGAMSGYYGSTTINSALAASIFFEANGDGQNIYFYDVNNNFQKSYIIVSLNDTHINFTFSTAVPTIPWMFNGSFLTYNIDGTDYAIGGTSSYKTISGCLASDTEYNKVIFEMVTGISAETFSTLFLANLTCDATGQNAPTYENAYSWNEYSELYLQMNGYEQEELLNAYANENSADVIEKAMARYDYIVAKYGYTNFIGRSISSSANRMMNIITDSSGMFAIITSFVILSSTAIAIFLFRKKKTY